MYFEDTCTNFNEYFNKSHARYNLYNFLKIVIYSQQIFTFWKNSAEYRESLFQG